MFMKYRAQFLRDLEASTLCEDTLQEKNDALLASFAKPYVTLLLRKSRVLTLFRSVPHKLSLSKQRSVKMEAAGQPVTILI